MGSEAADSANGGARAKVEVGTWRPHEHFKSRLIIAAFTKFQDDGANRVLVRRIPRKHGRIFAPRVLDKINEVHAAIPVVDANIFVVAQ